MSKPKVSKPPPPPPPEATPEAAPEVEETESRRVRRQMGYQRHILTGSLAPSRSGQTVLG